MERLSTDYSWAIAVITALGGWKLVNWILNRRELKRKALAEAINIETDSLVKRYNVMEEELEKLKQQVEELQETVSRLQEDKLALMQRNNELQLQLREAESHICLRPDDECLKRLPKRTYCRLKRLSQGYYDKYYIKGKNRKITNKNVRISEESDKG